MNHYIYIIKNLLNNKVYVGQTKNPTRRWQQHQYDCFVKNETWTRLYYSMRKHGVNNFLYSIVEECDVQDIDQAEIHWIATLKTTDRSIGYNQDNGGGANRIVSEETRIKIGNAIRGKTHSKETKMKISIANSGKKRSEESKIKQSISNIGRTHTKETKEKISKSHKGMKLPPHTDEAKQKMSQQRRGENNIKAKLSEQDVHSILELCKTESSNSKIASQFKVKKLTIWKIRTGKAWKHIPRN